PPVSSPILPYPTLFRSRLGNDFILSGAAQLKRDPLGAQRSYPMPHPIRLVGAAGLMVLSACAAERVPPPPFRYPELLQTAGVQGDRKSTRLNSSHVSIS